MEEQYRMYLAYLEDLRKQLESLTALAKEKPPAVAADDLAALNDIMKREHADRSRPARGCKRNSALKKRGCPNCRSMCRNPCGNRRGRSRYH